VASATSSTQMDLQRMTDLGNMAQAVRRVPALARSLRRAVPVRN
jgi:hypothetical protein